MFHSLCSFNEVLTYNNVSLSPIPTNDNGDDDDNNNNNKFLADAILIGFDKLYPKRIPNTPMRGLISLQRDVVENSYL
jgi:hypothetical protein